jgi:hypothetical protein
MLRCTRRENGPSSVGIKPVEYEGVKELSLSEGGMGKA